MTVPSLGLGLVGCGSFGAYVLDAVAGLPGLHIAAVADPEPSRAKPLGDRHGVAALDGLDALLGTEGVDIIALATPPATHAEMAVAALRAGKHVFCEKPLATTTEDAARVRDEADRSAGTLVVDHVLRYNPCCAPSSSSSPRGCWTRPAASSSRTTQPTRTSDPTTGSGTRSTAAASSSNTASTSSTRPVRCWAASPNRSARRRCAAPAAPSTW